MTATVNSGRRFIGIHIGGGGEGVNTCEGSGTVCECMRVNYAPVYTGFEKGGLSIGEAMCDGILKTHSNFHGELRRSKAACEQSKAKMHVSTPVIRKGAYATCEHG